MLMLGNVGPDAAADPHAIVQGHGYRFTVLTSRLVRLEWSAGGAFVDLPTQMVVRRRFPVPEFTVQESETSLDIRTEHLHLAYDKRRFSPAGLSISLRRRAQAGHRTTWHYGDSPDDGAGPHGNLRGTVRTLDDVDGACELAPGLLAPYGYAVVEDSRSVQLTDDGWLAARDGDEPGEDLYFFGYGRDYRGALQDFFRLTGPTPLLPRWALGNWWSRYHRYTADEYLGLMDRFATEGIPFSVAVLDIDWHLVDIDPELGSGWTGYTWNTELFPDPAAFLRALHERGLAVSLNVHPADGVRRHEASYADVARDLGIDPSSGLEIAFDITSREFTESYLNRLHHPHEEIGVDFWWLDWQSGAVTRVPGLDPLWMLNHVHYVDSGREGKRALTFSRYAGLGSHRYPVGFSGDTVVTWASLDFQPYFTATAANVGYFWWSHDIGGHLGGAKDDELAARWYQFGVFSPINRLHSSRSVFNSKEPWRFSGRAELAMVRFLRLRHQLVPYLYSASWVSHAEGVGLVRPMYHDYPQAAEAYEVPNQYMFGPDLLVAPITSPAHRHTHLAEVTVWLPEGTWFDFFTGRRYQGGRTLVLHRPLEEMPVLARAGAVIPLLLDPLADVGFNPEALLLRVFPADSGRCVLYEDAGAGSPAVADRQETAVSLTWREGEGTADVVVAVAPPSGPGVRTVRSLTLELIGVTSVEQTVLRVNGREPRDLGLATMPEQADGVAWGGAPTPLLPVVRLELATLDLTEGAEVTLLGVRLGEIDLTETAFALLDDAEISFAQKDRAYGAVCSLSGTVLIAALHALDLPGNLYGALVEIVSADDPGQRRRADRA